MALSTLACASENDDGRQQQQVIAPQADKSPVLEVYKRASCGCCGKWITHMETNGYQVIAHNLEDLSALKREKGVPAYYQSCHTAVSETGYVFEGHIPARIVQQFLAEKPAGAIGLTVPAMPVGSPGMEVGKKFMPYDVLMLKADGTVARYAHIDTQEEQY
ncbi:MAG: DUF411 domain-containing protein [Gammaproteobacteria bacterium]|nr:DUF411 domain-containing protein [Gammaproteobacteria bacterium]